MPGEVWTPIITGVGGLLVAAATTYYGPRFKARHDKRAQAAQVASHYSLPLLRSAFDLQSRLYNIVRQRFLQDLDGADSRRSEYAELSTLWLLGQYLGWVEILRREVQFLEFESPRGGGRLQDHLAQVAAALASDSRVDDPLFQISRSEQRAIGELMIVVREVADGGKRTDAMGYTEFVQKAQDASFGRWFEPFRTDLHCATGELEHRRLVWVQRRLVDLIDFLDPVYARFPDRDQRGRLPLGVSQRADDGSSIARFILRTDSPWRAFDAWQKATGGRGTLKTGPSTRRARQSLGPFACLVVRARYRDSWLELRSWVRPRLLLRWFRIAPPRVPIEGGGWRAPLARRRARSRLNDLLRRYDRPLLR